ncbi:ATP-binding cassette domain-containing protein [Bacillus thuringiensis]|uniref:ATP-binding cassette domain-containing protein n=1 Tax=Bacillus thuringiensis TaxID=1428 RepID=UPI000BF4403A|nr:ATP-binding cassette domain-containing protein [Bacillus thuringiensis]PFK82733.1 hypothetical protein COJ04_29375 [Bacillus thuringiensis]
MLVELRGIQKKYDKSLILDNIDLSISEGEALAIVGGNGTGKSTLLKIIAGFVSPTAGALQRKEHILLSLKQHGISILFTCHEKQLLENFADRIVTLANHTITEDIFVQKGAEQVYIEAIVHETFSAIELKKQSGFIHVAHNANQNLIQLQIEKEYTNEMLQFLLHKKASITLLQPNF